MSGMVEAKHYMKMNNIYATVTVFLLLNIHFINCDIKKLSDFYPKLRDEYVSPYIQLYGGNYFPWKLLDLVPLARKFPRTNIPSFMANKKIDPMLFQIGIGKRGYGSVDPFLFKIGLGKKLAHGSREKENEKVLWGDERRRKDVDVYENGLRPGDKRQERSSSLKDSASVNFNENSLGNLDS